MLEAKQIDLGAQHILYDAGGQSNIDANWFDPDHLRSRQCITGSAQGRANTLFFTRRNREYVLRHYHRGGLIANIVNDRYVWTGLHRTRAWREWFLLARLRELDLPVPVPVAARVRRQGCFYRADLITEKIPNAVSLSDKLSQSGLSNDVWMQLGRVIARFHKTGLDHADLNAHNILLGDDRRVFVIDLDRGRIRNGGTGWPRGNLNRLLRSLNKLKDLRETFHFERDDWHALLHGYSAP